MWTCYQSETASETILVRTLDRMIAFGFQVIVLLAGHYPWRTILDRHLPQFQAQHPALLFLWGTEIEIAQELRLPGDHAAREETSYGLALLPEFVDLEALRLGRDAAAWPGGQAPPQDSWHPGVEFDPASPRFAQMGEDARTATAGRGEAHTKQLVEALAAQIQRHLSDQCAI
jgi:creatinine amidohydrolase/Fe(II)-dependent formamide hydrolase-like protein